MNTTEMEDNNQNNSELVQNELTDQKLQQYILEEFVMSMLLNQKLEQEHVEEFMVMFLMNQKRNKMTG